MIRDLKQYDVILVDFGNNTVGSEQGGVRPSVIIQNDIGNRYSPTTLVIPFTKNIKKNPKQPTHALITRKNGNGLTVDSMLLGEAIKQVSEERIVEHLGSISDAQDQKEVRRVYFANFG